MINKKSYVMAANTTVELPGNQGAIEIIAVALKASTDTSVSLTITDLAPTARTIFTAASADFTTRVRRYVGPLEANVFDTAGDPSANTEGQAIGVVAENGLLFTVGATVGTGDLQVDIYYRPLFKTSVVMDALNLVSVLDMPSAVSNVKAVSVLSSADVTVDLIITDALGSTIQTFANADYTTRINRAIGPAEAATFDTAGVAGADTEGTETGVIAEGNLTCTSTTLASGTFTVDVFTEF